MLRSGSPPLEHGLALLLKRRNRFLRIFREQRVDHVARLDGERSLDAFIERCADVVFDAAQCDRRPIPPLMAAALP